MKWRTFLRPVCTLLAGHRFEPVSLDREECMLCDLARHSLTHQLFGQPRWFLPRA
jgi:hypothetical protein